MTKGFLVWTGTCLLDVRRLQGEDVLPLLIAEDSLMSSKFSWAILSWAEPKSLCPSPEPVNTYDWPEFSRSLRSSIVHISVEGYLQTRGYIQYIAIHRGEWDRVAGGNQSTTSNRKYERLKATFSALKSRLCSWKVPFLAWRWLYTVHWKVTLSANCSCHLCYSWAVLLGNRSREPFHRDQLHMLSLLQIPLRMSSSFQHCSRTL